MNYKYVLTRVDGTKDAFNNQYQFVYYRNNSQSKVVNVQCNDCAPAQWLVAVAKKEGFWLAGHGYSK